MESSIEIVEPKLFAAIVADEIAASVNDAINERGVCSLVLAGGSTPGSIYRILSKPPRVSDVQWDKVRLYIGDERWVPREDNQSNAKMVHETFLSQIPTPSPKFYPVDTTLGSPQQGAESYAALIRDVEHLSAGQDPMFDIVLLGMGEDGHTASLFPGSPMLGPPGMMAGKICGSAPHPQGGHRVSMTSEAIFNARKVFFIVKGESKASMLKRVIEGQEEVSVLPARLYTRASGHVTWFLDSEAARHLSHQRS